VKRRRGAEGVRRSLRSLGRGKRVPLMLTFGRAGAMRLEMTVKAAGAPRSAMKGKGYGDLAPGICPGG
jgi:hypothetical protein